MPLLWGSLSYRAEFELDLKHLSQVWDEHDLSLAQLVNSLNADIEVATDSSKVKKHVEGATKKSIMTAMTVGRVLTSVLSIWDVGLG